MRDPVRWVANLTWQSDRAETGSNHPKVVLLELVSHRRNKARAFVNLKFNFTFTKSAVRRHDNRVLFEMSSVEKCTFDRFLKHLQFT